MHYDNQIIYDIEGYLMNPEDWSERICALLAAQEGIVLNSSYWPVILYMRNYWVKHRIAPDVRHVIDFLASEQGCKKKEAKEYLFKLFPYGYVKQACKVAGMQRPRAWSTG